ncbi:MAG: hypothetical protein D6744_03865 [Planctomycetota bacterium]|nr:MAG: hypothetical protein D6744_03865 [Planctomycetota bacterium]
MSSNLFIFPSSFTDSNGGGTMPFVMTSDPAQAGIQWYTQAFNRDPVSPTMLSVSNVWFSVAHIASAGTGTVTPLTLLDDGSALVPLGFSFDYFGTPYTEVYVNANGNLTFGQPNAAFFVDESVFVGGPPCIAPFWTDLNPEFGGTVEWDTTAAPGVALTVRYNGVFSNLVGGASTCEVTLLAGGHVFMTYGNVDVTEGIAGLSPGGSATTNSIDLSTPGVYGFSPPVAVYEVFTAQSQFDLDNALVSYGWIPGAGYLLMY